PRASVPALAPLCQPMAERQAIARSSISDICLLVQDLERAISFYRDQVGFELRRLAPGFADFFTGGVTLALWQVDHMQSHLGLPPEIASRGGGGAIAARPGEKRA